MKGRSQSNGRELQSMTEALEEQLKLIFSAEQIGVKAMISMAESVHTAELKKALSIHAKQSQKQIERLTKAGRLLGRDLKGKECAAMRALLQNGEDIVSEYAPSPLRDILIIAAQQQVEHFEISAYGMVRGLAEALELDEVAQLLEESLDEEMTQDEVLTDAAEDIFSMFAGEDVDFEEDEELEEELDLERDMEEGEDLEEESPRHRR